MHEPCLKVREKTARLWRNYAVYVVDIILHYPLTILHLLHATLPTYKTLHKITELFTMCYIAYLYHLQYITSLTVTLLT